MVINGLPELNFHHRELTEFFRLKRNPDFEFEMALRFLFKLLDAT
jgi:hypothetical protein